jgi:hypothetical protein
MAEATKTLSPERRRDHRLVFELALAISLCIWIVTLIAWALS